MNTRKIEKELLKPFLSKYRKLIIKARFTGNKKPLFDAIGRSNYEELNDIVNKVHSLREALLEKRGEGKVDKELKKQLERLDGVYTAMQEYKSGWAY